MTYEKELYHYGIKGQKWGVRRFQNPDGSYTSEGRIHYGIKGTRTGNSSDVTNSVTNKVKDAAQNAAENVADPGGNKLTPEQKAALKKAAMITAGVAAAGAIGYVAYKNLSGDSIKTGAEKLNLALDQEDSIKNMKDSDLEAAIKRLQLENQYKVLSGQGVEGQLAKAKKEKQLRELQAEDITKGRSFAEKLLIGSGTAAVSAFVTTLSKEGGRGAALEFLKQVFSKDVWKDLTNKKSTGTNTQSQNSK